MRLLLSILLMLLLVPSWTGDERLAMLGHDARIIATPMPLDPADPSRRRVGRLTYLGGVRLSSPDATFGGFSAMAVQGDRFTLLSDGGNIARFRLGPDWRIRSPAFSDLPDGPGTGWQKEDRDSESLTIDPATGLAWAAFETSNQIWRYSPGFARGERMSLPPAMRGWPINQGAEAMTRLHDGRFVAIDEAVPWPKGHGRAALVFASDPTEAPGIGFRFSYLPPRGYDPSDMTELPDGRLVVLNRRLAWPDGFSAKLVIIDRAAIRPGVQVRGREIGTIAKPLTRDNFEGVAATREDGRTILWIVSDDNQFLVESTLLMKFRLEP